MGICRISILSSIILMGCMVSCVKDPQDIPPGFTSDPVFGMAATLGGEAVNIDAGTNGWTLLPGVEPFDSLGTYTAVFSIDGCTEQCAPSWTFRFYQALPAVNDPALAFSNTIHTGEKEFILADQERDSFEILLTTHPGLFMSGYSYWEDLNGPGTTFYHEFQSTVGYQQNLNVCFQSLAYTGCLYTQCIYFDPATQVPCILSIEPILENAGYMSLQVMPEGTPPFQIQWFNGATSSSIVIPLQDSLAEIYATVSVTDAVGNRSELAQSIRLQNGIVDACYFPISLASIPFENNAISAYADRVEILYLDEQGVTWRSSVGIQSDDAKVIIDQINSYQDAPSGQPSYLVELSIRAKLFNEITGDEKLFETQRLSLALSHL